MQNTDWCSNTENREWKTFWKKQPNHNIWSISVLTIRIQVIRFISPASGFDGVAGSRATASTFDRQEVGESEGLPLLVLLFS